MLSSKERTLALLLQVGGDLITGNVNTHELLQAAQQLLAVAEENEMTNAKRFSKENLFANADLFANRAGAIRVPLEKLASIRQEMTSGNL